jgi:hypothetical protein
MVGKRAIAQRSVATFTNGALITQKLKPGAKFYDIQIQIGVNQAQKLTGLQANRNARRPQSSYQ